MTHDAKTWKLEPNQLVVLFTWDGILGATRNELLSTRIQVPPNRLKGDRLQSAEELVIYVDILRFPLRVGYIYISLYIYINALFTWLQHKGSLRVKSRPPGSVPLRPWILLLILTFLPRKSCSIAGNGLGVFAYKRTTGWEMKKVFVCFGWGCWLLCSKGCLILY